jgi:hypothetical protein
MQRSAFLLLAFSVLLFAEDVWKSGPIKVLDTDEWCGRPGIADWPGLCDGLKGNTALFSDSRGASARPVTPYSQILEIDGPDAVYIVKRTSLDTGLKFRPGALAQFAVAGKHLKIKFDQEETTRHGELRVRHEQATTDILETRAPVR